MAKKSKLAPETVPIQVAIGWIEQNESKRDAIDYARGYVDARFHAKDSSWFGIEPFMGGWLWEAHEGGPGKGHLKAIVSELTANQGGEYWVPSGPKKIVRISMRDGRPFAITLPEDESSKTRNSGQAPLLPNTKLRPFSSSGVGLLAFGATSAACSLAYFITAAAFYASVWQPGPTVQEVDLKAMPHAQWGSVEATNPEQIVSKLEMIGGVWQKPEVRQNLIPELEKERSIGKKIDEKFEKQELPLLQKPETLVAPTVAPAVTPSNPGIPSQMQIKDSGAGVLKPQQNQPAASPTKPLPPMPGQQGAVSTKNPAQAPAAQPPAGINAQTKKVLDQLEQIQQINRAAAKANEDAMKKTTGEKSLAPQLPVAKTGENK